MLRWLLRLTAALFLALALAVITLGLRLTGSVPTLDGELATSVEAVVTIERDEHGVPHIRAQSRRDAFFGLGFVHAQDRLWQMHLARRNVTGRLSEIFGKLAFKHDLRMRALGYGQLAKASYDRQPESIKRLLKAYADGVNAYLGSDHFKTPPEFVLTMTTPEPWSPADSAFVLFSFWPMLGKNLRTERLQAELSELVSPEVARTLLRPFPSSGRVALDIEDLVATLGPEARAATATAAPPQAPTQDADGHSNNWAIGPSRSASGAPLLANDPHLRLNTPSVWYLAHLSYEGRDMVGATAPGAPGIVIGRNRDVAWGFTTSQVDTDDGYWEETDPDQPNRYRTAEGWAEFETREATIDVRFDAPVTVNLRATRNGPLLPRELWATDATPPHRELSLRSIAQVVEDRTLSFFMGLNHAQSFDEAYQAARNYSLPTHNMVVASRGGDIGYVMVGPIPVRGPQHETRGLAPARGWRPENAWKGILPFESRLVVKNPRAGFIVTANGKIAPDTFAHEITGTWPDPGRAARIEKVLLETEKHDLDSMARMQNDFGSTKVHETLPFLLRTPPETDRRRRALDLLRSWDGSYAEDLPQPSIYTAFMMSLTDRIYRDELGPGFERARGRRPEIVRDAFGGSLAEWCDDTTTPAEETCEGLLGPALDEALTGLEAAYGSDYASWRWGEQMVMTHRHLGLGLFPVVGPIFSTQTPRGGGPSTPNVAYVNRRALPRIEARGYGASLRFLTDLSDLDGSRYVLSTGQSGHFRSPHYADLQKKWAKGEYIRIPTAPGSYSVEATFELSPE